jgi:hypothetical protein
MNVERIHDPHRLGDLTLNAGDQVAELSRWFDGAPCNIHRTPDEAMLLRAIKIFEETGEMAGNIIGLTGQNPRKGVTSSMDAAIDEAADGIVTLLGFIEHVTGNQGVSLQIALRKINKVHLRMRMYEATPADSDYDA